MNDLLREKAVWTEKDLDAMNWYYCSFYATAFFPDEFEIAFDIDYILKWLDPAEGEKYYKFIVSPATLVFENINELNLEISEPDAFLHIQSISKGNRRTPKNSDAIKNADEWFWTIELTSGIIEFYSVGFKQYIRKTPRISDRPKLGLATRGGISFDRVGFEPDS